MTKSELTEKMDFSNRETQQIVDTIFDAMEKALVKGNGIEIRGFGSFSVREYAGYVGRNPKTGQSIEVGPKKLPFFKTGKDLAKSVKNAK